MQALPSSGLNHRHARLALASLLALTFLLYLPHVGRGFVKDDFNWLDNGIQDGAIEAGRPFRVSTGFFRPLVSLTYACQYALSGLDPSPYGWFNLLLHLCCTVLIYRLLLRLWKSPTAALAVSGLFALSLKPTAMALGWISGRTSLLMAIASLAALLALPPPDAPRRSFGRRAAMAGMLFFLALLAKESAIALLALAPMLAFLTGEPTPPGRRLFRPLSLLFVLTLPLAGYLLLRMRSDAFGIGNAPDYYRLAADPVRLLLNLSELVGRGAVLDILVVLLLGLLLLAGGGAGAVAAAWREGLQDCRRWRCLPMGLLWFLLFALPVVALPVRSDLYAYMPQVGLHMVAAPWLVALAGGLTRLPHSWKRAGAALMLAFALLWGAALWRKAARYAAEGDVSRSFMGQASTVLAACPHGARVTILDCDAGRGDSPSRAVGYALPAMLRLLFPGRQLDGTFLTAADAGGTESGADCRLEWSGGWLARRTPGSAQQEVSGR